MADTSENLNRAILQWQANTLSIVKGRLRSLNIQGKKALLATVKGAKARENLMKRIGKEGLLVPSVRKGTPKYQYGEIYRVGFRFSRQGAFLIKGAGRGHKSSNPRDKKDFINEVMDDQVPVLANIVMEIDANKILNAAKVKI